MRGMYNKSSLFRVKEKKKANKEKRLREKKKKKAGRKISFSKCVVLVHSFKSREDMRVEFGQADGSRSRRGALG